MESERTSERKTPEDLERLRSLDLKVQEAIDSIPSLVKKPLPILKLAKVLEEAAHGHRERNEVEIAHLFANVIDEISKNSITMIRGTVSAKQLQELIGGCWQKMRNPSDPKSRRRKRIFGLI